MDRRIALSILLLSALRLPAADGDRTVVAMHLNLDIPAWSGQGIDFGLPRDAKVIAEPGAARDGKVAGLAVRATRLADKPGAYSVRFTSSDGQSVTTEITGDAPARVEIRRRAGLLPYQFGFDPHSGPNHDQENMHWSANYRAEGTLAIGDCHATMAIWDLTSDGTFDRRDFHQGTAVGIDLNGDGKIGGKGELISGGEVFQFCGRRFFVDPDSLEPDGSAVTIVETGLEKPKIGSPVPTLLMETTDGKTIRSADWKDKVVLLDFWASWCGYCIAAFPKLKQMQEQQPDLQLISVNTDEPNAIAAARKVVATHDMPWPKIMSGKGLSDPLWMMFQGLEHSMPLYIVIDPKGIVRYSGSGGEDLAELRSALSNSSR
jgi:thiol-disulfide isomerase/thioredoxin